MRAFIGISVPVTEEIRSLLKIIGGHAELKAVEPENLHINLKFLGEVDEEKAAEVGKTLDELSGFGPFDVQLKGVGAFPNQNFVRVVWIGAESEKLMPLAGLVEKECERLGFAKEHDYVPHVTLARAKQRLPDELKSIFGDKMFGTFRAEEVKLVRSELAPGGPKYTDIHVVKL
jgi:2'-5' RNA ligase